MNKSIISDQLKHDYPDYNIYLDVKKRMVVADDHKMSLLNSSSALQTLNIFSRSGKSFYQAITQLLCSNYNIIPKEGSYADSLIIRQEDLDRYKVQKLAKEWGIGFLENSEADVLVLEVDDGIERKLLLENDDALEKVDEELEEWAQLEEIDFDSQIAYIEKGLEFAAELEEIKMKDKIAKNELAGIHIVESTVKNRNLNFSIKKLVKKFFTLKT